MDSYTSDIELEMVHWLANVPQAAHSVIVRQAIVVGYYGGFVGNANSRDQYSAAMELYKDAQQTLGQMLKDIK